MKSLFTYIIEKSEEKESKEKKPTTNVENMQKEIDNYKSSESNQISDLTPDAIKSLLINSDNLNNCITIVNKKDSKFIIKFAEKDYLNDLNNISKTIMDIAKYFKEIMGAKEVKLDDKKYIMTVK